jgi:hypothetical protein
MPTISYILATASPEFVVNATTANNQSAPDVAMLSNGDLFFTFDADSPSNVAFQDAMYRRFTFVGSALDANDREISAGPNADDEEDTQIAILSNGNFVVVDGDNEGGSDDDVEFNILTSAGDMADPHNIVVQAEGFASDNQFSPRVAALTGGGFVVLYIDEFAGSVSNTNAEFVIFENDGSFRAGPVIAGGASTALAVLDPTVTALTNGNFVAAWRQDLGGGDHNVRFRIFNSNGVALGATEVTVSTDLDIQSQPVMAALPGGGFALVLRDAVNGSATNTELELRIYNSSGTQVGTTQTWNPGAFDLMSQPDIALISSNLLLVSYTSDRNSNSDVFGQLFTLDGTLVGVELSLAVGSGSQNASALASIGASGRFAMAWADDVPEGADASGFHVSGQVRQVFRITNGDATGEVLTGDDLRDAFRGNGGNDVIDGGAATDSATYDGNIRSYRFDFLGGDNLRITDLRPGSPEGTDTLHSVEGLGFVADASTLLIALGTPGDDNILAGTNRAINAGGGNDTLTFDFALVNATVTFAGNAMLIESGVNHIVASGFERYVFTDGTVDNNDGSPLVDDLFYFSQYHDVWNAGIDAELHYGAAGRHEGRDPNAFFDTSLYRMVNPDVGGADPLLHFDTIGWSQGRVPSLNFGTREYLLANPDVAAANVDPLWHFLAVGASEGRVPIAPARLVGPSGFDYAYYLNTYADVRAAGVDPLWHFQTAGWSEGRNPNALFDTAGYLSTYTDVAAAHINPFDHYNIAGWHEGRDPSVNFDTTSYLSTYTDVAAAGANPLTHYLQSGIHEGRSAFADGVWG